MKNNENQGMTMTLVLTIVFFASAVAEKSTSFIWSALNAAPLVGGSLLLIFVFCVFCVSKLKKSDQKL